MYESHFGITGPPFQLSPDPSFYFDSRGHHAAMQELRRALAEPAGIVVVSGEVGAGKTTLMRTLLAEGDGIGLAVAQVVSTQLGGDDVLRAVLLAFGLATDGAPPAEMFAAIHRHVDALARDGRRAVLIVDEAQNLQRDAFERLVELDRDTPTGGAPLKLCLVGQPELRELVDSGDLLALRARVGMRCHLGPLALAEVGPYIEHRLRKVGWSGTPSFAPDAFDAIHAWTQGIPRRINLLCNRLLLARFLDAGEHIDAESVAQIARDLRVEVGDSAEAPQPLRSALPPPPAPAPPAAAPPARLPSPLLCVVAGEADHVKAAPLLHALAAQQGLPAVLLVRVLANDAFDRHAALYGGLQLDGRVLSLGISHGTYAEQASEMMKRIEFVFDHCHPVAAIVFDGGGAALACGLVAGRKGVPVLHVGAGRRGADPRAAADVTRRLTDQLADLNYTAELAAHSRLEREGVPPERICLAGSLQVDALRRALRAAPDQAELAARLGLDPRLLAHRNGYVLVALGSDAASGERPALADIVSVLRDVSRDVPVIWTMDQTLRDRLARARLTAYLDGEPIACVPEQPYGTYAPLLGNATCVVSDSWHVHEEAIALGVPLLAFSEVPGNPALGDAASRVVIGSNKALATRALWRCMFAGDQRRELPEFWDGQAAPRIAEHLALWLAVAAPSAAHAAAAKGEPA